MRINKAWHLANKMPRNASQDERIRWHLEHARACACRPVPPKLLEEVDRRKAG